MSLPEVTAESASAAIGQALTGTVRVAWKEKTADYPFGPAAVGATKAAHKPFVAEAKPTAADPDRWRLGIEDLQHEKFRPLKADWDYNDRYWIVTVSLKGDTVRVVWIQGTTPAGDKQTDGLFKSVIEPLQKKYKDQNVEWHEFKTGVLSGQILNKPEAGRDVEEEIAAVQAAHPGDRFLLVGYSWGALIGLYALHASQVAPNGRLLKQP
ncbi:MAG: hypothetical protein ACRC7O_09950, partial [Fimbriiglobus sp.]